MNLSLNWLKQFLDLSKHSPSEIAEILTMKTCEVEAIAPIFDFSNNLIVGEVKTVEQHPNALKLKICETIADNKKFIIVTAAKNVTTHKKYPLAIAGATLPNGLTIKTSNLRGIESEGMLCSAEELGMQDFIFPHIDQSGDLLELPSDAISGKLLSNIFSISDIVLYIDNKSLTHRPDLWGHFGFARELSALLSIPLKKNPLINHTHIQAISSPQQEDNIHIEIKDNAALNYSGAILKNINLKPSPINLQALLIAAGMHPINNVVDASNYVMLELGQPNHAFDKDQITDNIEVSFSKEGEEIITLDLKTRKLPHGIPLIRMKGYPIAIGGIIGGRDTEVTNNTKTIFLESATFHRDHIRKGVSSLSLRTEASQRFEKGLDPSLTKPAILRFAEILREGNPDLKISQIQTKGIMPSKKNKIETTFSYIFSRLGNIDLSTNQIITILNSLNMKCESNGDHLHVEVPSYRSYYDIEIPEDLIEEVARVVGYKKIKEEALLLPCKVPYHSNKLRKLEHQLRNLFSYSYHFTEVYNYSFHSAQEISLDTRYTQNAVKLTNPIQQEQKYLRISPLPSLLKNITENYKQNNELSLYEIERIFLLDHTNVDALPEEKLFIAGILISTQKDSKILTFLASILGDVLSRLGLIKKNQKYEALQEDIFHPGRGGLIRSKLLLNSKTSNVLFKWGEIHPKIVKEYHSNIDKKIFYFEAFLSNLVNLISNQSPYHPITKFPSSVFEMTILTDEHTPFQEIENIITTSQDKNLIKNIEEQIEFIGSFSGDQINHGKKAVSLKLTWVNSLKTIEHNELKTLQDSVIKNLARAGFPLK